MKKSLIISSVALGCLTLVLGLVLAPKANAKPPNATLTGQSIMVNLDAAGTFTIHENQTWKYDEDAAAALFTNSPDRNPAVVSDCSSHTSGPTTTVEVTNPGVQSPCDPGTVSEPAVPLPDASKLNSNGENDVVGDNKCAFLDGTALTGSTYTQSVDNSASCTYVSAVNLINGGPNAGKFNVTRRTVTKTCTFTWTYNITPLQSSYAAFTTWY